MEAIYLHYLRQELSNDVPLSG